MKKFLAILSIVAVLGSFSVVYAMRTETEADCHIYCAKAFGQNIHLYLECYSDCLNYYQFKVQ